jgi:hypothetical protein
MSNDKLRVFLCHSSTDKPIVRELYQRLLAEGWIDPWLDEEKLLPGQDWDIEIEKAVEAADVVVVCLSNKSISKEGYVQKEIRFALNIALFKPEESIFIVPLRLDDCPLPRNLQAVQYTDYFPSKRKKQAYARLLQSMKIRSEQVLSGLPKEDNPVLNIQSPDKPWGTFKSTMFRFIGRVHNLSNSFFFHRLGVGFLLGVSIQLINSLLITSPAVYTFYLDLILSPIAGGLAGYLVNRIEKNKSPKAGGLAGLIVAIMCVIGYFLAFSLPHLIGDLVNVNNIVLAEYLSSLYRSGGDAWEGTFVFMFPILVAGYIAGRVSARG